MAFKYYDVVRAAPPSDLAEKLTHKLKEGWYNHRQFWLLR